MKVPINITKRNTPPVDTAKDNLEKLREDAIASIKRSIERYKTDTEFPEYIRLIPSAELDFAYILGIITLDDRYMLHGLLDEAKAARAERSA